MIQSVAQGCIKRANAQITRIEEIGNSRVNIAQASESSVSNPRERENKKPREIKKKKEKRRENTNIKVDPSAAIDPSAWLAQHPAILREDVEYNEDTLLLK